MGHASWVVKVAKRLDLVYGGGSIGLMGLVTQAIHHGGGTVLRFVEMMAPVFSRASWSCAWHMIQNDLVHAWGLDFQLGYCAQGNRTKNIGIVDSEYITHYGLPTLGGASPSNKEQQPSDQPTSRVSVKKRSYVELEIFKNRWEKADKDNKCWTDPYQPSPKQREM